MALCHCKIIKNKMDFTMSFGLIYIAYSLNIVRYIVLHKISIWPAIFKHEDIKLGSVDLLVWSLEVMLSTWKILNQTTDKVNLSLT